MRYFLLLIAVGFIYGNLNAQTYPFLGSKVYGGDKGEECHHMLKFNENKLLLIGESTSGVSGNKTVQRCDSLGTRTDIWVVMVNTQFDILWQLSLGGDLNDQDATAINVGNGNILIAFTSESDSTCNRTTPKKGGRDILLYLVDSLGSIIWEKNFGTIQNCNGVHLTKLTDGNVILLTSTSAGIGNDKTGFSHGFNDVWLVKFQPNGNIIFDKTYGGSDNELPWSVENQYHYGLIETSPNEIAIFTYTMSSMSWDVSDTLHGNNDMWIFKIDSLGNKLSDFCYGGSGQDLFTASSKSTNGYLIGGTTSSPQSGSISQPPIAAGYTGWIISVDSSGNKVWDRRYQGGINSFNGNLFVAIMDIIPASNGDFWVTGLCNTDAGNDVSEPPYGDKDAWVFKMNSAGSVLWDKRFGSTKRTWTSNSVLMADSSIFLFCASDTGITNVKAEHGYGRTDYYLVHFRYANTTPLSELEFKQSQVQLYPNPTQDIINVNYSEGAFPDKLELYDFQGKMLRSINTHNNSIDVSHLSPSIYILKFIYQDGLIIKKFVKQ
jgi:hypothetical protein